MATKTTQTLPTNTSSVDVVNAVRNSASAEYSATVPVATQDNLSAIGQILATYQPIANEFLNQLVNRIVLVEIKSKLWNSPLKEFKRGLLEYGYTVEEVFTQIAQAHEFDQSKAETEIFKREIPDVKAMFHSVNREQFYKVTVSEQQLRQAFTSGDDGLYDLIQTLTQSLYGGDNYDEYVIMRDLIVNYIEKTGVKVVTTPEVTDEATAKKLAIVLRSMAKKFGFMSSEYNLQKVKTFTPLEDIVIFVTPEVEAQLDVESLAVAFHMDKADFLGRVVIVDSFGAADDVQAVITSKNWFMVYDTLMSFKQTENTQGLYWNYVFHHWGIYSTSEFENFVVVKKPSEV